MPEKIEEEEVVIIEDEEIQKEESTPRKRTRLGRRQSELMENESGVESFMQDQRDEVEKSFRHGRSDDRQ